MVIQIHLEAYPHHNKEVIALEVDINHHLISHLDDHGPNSQLKKLDVYHSQDDHQIMGTVMGEDKITTEVCYLSQCDLEF